MNILVTGAKGFVGKNLAEALKNIRDGKNRTRPNIQIDRLYEYDLDTPREVLEAGCREADFVFHLAAQPLVRRADEPKLLVKPRAPQLAEHVFKRGAILLAEHAVAGQPGALPGKEQHELRAAACAQS